MELSETDINELNRKYASVLNKGSILVCATCGEVWKGVGSPAICPYCNKCSFAVMRH